MLKDLETNPYILQGKIMILEREKGLIQITPNGGRAQALSSAGTRGRKEGDRPQKEEVYFADIYGFFSP